ncbi:N-acetylmuramoyl-L-alanine amidase [Paenibacillus peoriae]|uniref:N-acetylmuramoyl-L-alanine amidase n=1 Tax=Paenibacillus peoriae TaxID=59893 RepID=UPI0021169409|nr:N-acetylmuramoyl-L-alanine amidase [Paenibacillus peoriae]
MMRMESKIDLIMQEAGIEWDANTPNEDLPNYLKGPKRPFLLFWAMSTYAQDADKSNNWRDNEMAKKTIVIDAGHGAKDPGAVGPAGKKEKDFNLTMAIKVEAFLKDNPELKVILTRGTDVFLELKERVSIANKAGADAFVSIHANSSSNPEATGTETYYMRPTSKNLANTIHKYMVAATGLRDRGVAYGNFQVIRSTTMDAVLVEVGFISNAVEEATLFDNDFQNNVALAIAKGLCAHIGVPFTGPDMKPTPVPVEPKPTETAPYPAMEVIVGSQEFTGYSIKNVTFVPSRPIGEMLGGKIGYTGGKVTINGDAVETVNINGIGHVPARALTTALGARIFWDKTNPKRVDIFPKL